VQAKIALIMRFGGFKKKLGLAFPDKDIVGAVVYFHSQQFIS
jgi:hypothetical protein